MTKEIIKNMAAEFAAGELLSSYGAADSFLDAYNVIQEDPESAVEHYDITVWSPFEDYEPAVLASILRHFADSAELLIARTIDACADEIEDLPKAPVAFYNVERTEHRIRKVTTLTPYDIRLWLTMSYSGEPLTLQRICESTGGNNRGAFESMLRLEKAGYARHVDIDGTWYATEPITDAAHTTEDEIEDYDGDLHEDHTTFEFGGDSV